MNVDLADGLRRIVRGMGLALVCCAVLSARVCLAQESQVEVVPLKIGASEASFSLERGEVAVVPPAEGATAYVQAVLGKHIRFSQCYFVLDSDYRRKLVSGKPTTEQEDRQGLRSMIVITQQACDTAFLRQARIAAVASTKDKRALTEHFKETQARATKEGSGINPLKVSPEEAVRQIGQAGLISESDRHFTIGMGSDQGVVISTHLCADSKLIVFVQWTDQKNFPRCIERSKAFVDTLIAQTKAAK